MTAHTFNATVASVLRLACLLSAAALLLVSANSVVAATYLNRSTPFGWVDPASHPRVAWTNGASCSSGYVGAAIDDDISAQLPLGFTFTYGGVNYTQVQIMSNGRLQFNNGFCGYGTQTVGPPPTYPYPYPNASVVRTMRVYGVDLDPTPSGGAGACPTASCYVSYTTTGTAPNRRFVVTWVNVPEWGRSSRTGYFNLQVILEEATQEFVYQFGPSSHPTGGSAQIGWELTTTDFDVWSTPVVPPANSAVRFFLPTPVAEFRLDETAWSGAGSIVNSTAGGSNGSPVGTAQPVTAGRVCGGGTIPANTSTAAIDAIDTGYDVDSGIGSSGTVTFWYRSNSAWSGGGSKAVQLLDATVANNRWFYLARQNGNGRLSFTLTDAANNNFQATTGNLAYAAGTWVHVAVTWKLTPIAANNRMQIFVNGALARTTAIGTTQPLSNALGSLYAGDNRSAFATNPGTGNSADGVIDEIRIYNSEVPNAVILRDYNATRSCVPPAVTPAGFNAFESTTAANSVSGVIKTKVSASGFGLDVVALKTGGTAVETAFTGDVKLELVDASSGGGCGALPLVRALGTLTFAATHQGRKTQSGINEPNAWPNVRLRISYPATGAATVVACSTDNFAIRPASLAAMTVSDLNSTSSGTGRTLYNTGAMGGNVHKAGRPFRIAATARNLAGATTGNYAGSPSTTLTACVLPATGCTLGTLTTGAWVASAGIVVAANASYSEVGAFTMKLVDANFAAVDAGDGSTAAERTIESAPFTVGRFVPDHFHLTPVGTPTFKTFDDTSCATRSFTYVGQPFGYLPTALPQVTIEARNAAGGITRNYSGALWKLLPADATQTYTPLPVTLDNALVQAPTLTSAGNGTGSLVANPSDKLAYVRNSPVAEFNAVIDLAVSVADATENPIAGNGTIATAAPAVFSSIAFDAGNLIRFGRLALSNAQGSELLGLPVPIETQFWNATGFSRNTIDHCTQLAANTVALSNWQRNLNACETSVTLTGRFNAGRGNLRLSAPGQGNTGSVDLTIRMDGVGGGTTCVGGVTGAAAGAGQSWLQIRGNTAAYNQNPVARGSFGLFRGSRSLIYMRELY
ncbi:MAG: LamG domain-containing protein [Thiobacillus sp.]|nr:LamG domain-containing protein [Thiobacillus sp.]